MQISWSWLWRNICRHKKITETFFCSKMAHACTDKSVVFKSESLQSCGRYKPWKHGKTQQLAMPTQTLAYQRFLMFQGDNKNTCAIVARLHIWKTCTYVRTALRRSRWELYSDKDNSLKYGTSVYVSRSVITCLRMRPNQLMPEHVAHLQEYLHACALWS